MSFSNARRWSESSNGSCVINVEGPVQDGAPSPLGSSHVLYGTLLSWNVGSGSYLSAPKSRLEHLACWRSSPTLSVGRLSHLPALLGIECTGEVER